MEEGGDTVRRKKIAAKKGRRPRRERIRRYSLNCSRLRSATRAVSTARWA